MSGNAVNKLLKEIKKYVKQNSALLVACSGGADSAALTEEQHNKLIDAYFAICEKLYKIYSYQEFIPYDLNFLHDKKILCEKQLSARLFGNSPLLPNGNTLVLYDQAQEWERLKEKWLNE